MLAQSLGDYKSDPLAPSRPAAQSLRDYKSAPATAAPSRSETIKAHPLRRLRVTGDYKTTPRRPSVQPRWCLSDQRLRVARKTIEAPHRRLRNQRLRVTLGQQERLRGVATNGRPPPLQQPTLCRPETPAPRFELTDFTTPPRSQVSSPRTRHPKPRRPHYGHSRPQQHPLSEEL